ncbi:MAG: hypothetical protein GPJ54_11145 [Candidatus Heimdallarchaeota archaeon]|nr:hypothetical protein [Candidatus Heimdallarchaeota archaeon]
MKLVIFCDSYPPEKKTWSSPEINDRSDWSWISELIATWFCYSNGIRKENEVTIVIKEIQITLSGEKIRYLAPSQRSILSIVHNAYKGHLTQNKRKQPGVYVTKFTGYDQFESPQARISLTDKQVIQTTSNKSQIRTLFVEGMKEDITPIHILASNYNQALIWLIYG